jgi:hypothetical protein
MWTWNLSSQCKLTRTALKRPAPSGVPAERCGCASSVRACLLLDPLKWITSFLSRRFFAENNECAQAETESVDHFMNPVLMPMQDFGNAYSA